MKWFYRFFWIFIFPQMLWAASIHTSSAVLEISGHSMILDKNSVQSATLEQNSVTKTYGVRLTLKKEAANKLKLLTQSNKGKSLNLLLDDHKILSAPICSPLSADFLIPRLTKAQAKKLIQRVS